MAGDVSACQVASSIFAGVGNVSILMTIKGYGDSRRSKMSLVIGIKKVRLATGTTESDSDRQID